MRAARTNPTPRNPAHTAPVDGSFVMLREIVAQLAERVELLEARETIVKTALAPARSRHRPSS